jgi:hypothetical protein
MNEKSRPSKPDGVAKWKVWWDAHKGNYSDYCIVHKVSGIYVRAVYHGGCLQNPTH